MSHCCWQRARAGHGRWVRAGAAQDPALCHVQPSGSEGHQRQRKSPVRCTDLCGSISGYPLPTAAPKEEHHGWQKWDRTTAEQLELPQAAFSASCHCMWAKEPRLSPPSSPSPAELCRGSASTPAAPQHPNPSAGIPKPGGGAGGLPAALHSPASSPGSYHDFLVQRDSLMKWKRRRRSRLNGPS